MTPWDDFFHQCVRRIFSEKKSVIDIGAGLRAVPNRGNRYDPARAWIVPLIEKVDYKILDPVPDFNPDIVGDIHHLPFPDNSEDAIVCLAVLEHVANPWGACRELFRVLKPHGICFVYVPFLYYYHAETGYYADFWRFTKDSLKLLFRDFSSLEICPVRGAVETWMHLSPFGKYTIIKILSRLMDRVLHKRESKQVSGYYVYCVK